MCVLVQSRRTAYVPGTDCSVWVNEESKRQSRGGWNQSMHSLSPKSKKKPKGYCQRRFHPNSAAPPNIDGKWDWVLILIFRIHLWTNGFHPG